MKFFIQKAVKNEIIFADTKDLKMLITLTDAQIKDISEGKTIALRDNI